VPTKVQSPGEPALGPALQRTGPPHRPPAV